MDFNKRFIHTNINVRKKRSISGVSTLNTGVFLGDKTHDLGYKLYTIGPVLESTDPRGIGSTLSATSKESGGCLHGRGKF